MHVETFMFFQPCLHFRMFVGRVVVDDQMQLKRLGGFSIDLLEKLQPFLMSVLRFDGADQTTLKIVQRSEQSDCAVPDIIV